ncbi:MAG: hypothetical protein QM757_39265 [Paludibaculum sp.]
MTFYVAGNAANNSGTPQGDHIYTSSLSITEATGSGGSLQVPATAYDVRHLTSDLTGGWGEHVDPNLSNPWAIAMSPTSPFWISNAGTGTATVYDTNGAPAPAANPLIVKVPNGAGKNGPGRPDRPDLERHGGFRGRFGQTGRVYLLYRDGRHRGLEPRCGSRQRGAEGG